MFQVKKLERTDEESTTSSLVTTALVESPPHSGVGSVSSNGSRSESSLLACGSGCSGSDSGRFHATNRIKFCKNGKLFYKLQTVALTSVGRLPLSVFCV